MDCSICYEDITPATGHSTLSCNHTFHIGCMARWISESSTCPMCRHPLCQKEVVHQAPVLRDSASVSGFHIGNDVYVNEEVITYVRTGAVVSRGLAIRALMFQFYDGTEASLNESVDLAKELRNELIDTPLSLANPWNVPTDEQRAYWNLQRLFNPRQSLSRSANLKMSGYASN